jgi:hypothetical protein
VVEETLKWLSPEILLILIAAGLLHGIVQFVGIFHVLNKVMPYLASIPKGINDLKETISMRLYNLESRLQSLELEVKETHVQH